MAEVSGASLFERLSISGLWKKAARCCASVKPKLRCVEPLVGRVVVRDVGGVPELLVPGQEGLGSQFSQHAGVCEGGYELLVDELPEVAGTDAVLPPEVDQGSGARLLAGLCHLVPAGRVRQTGVEQGAPEDVDFVLERELGLLASPKRGYERLEGERGDAVDL